MLKIKNKGISILGIVFLCFIAILILSYFKISVKDVVEGETGQENIGYVKENTKSVWEKYLKEPAEYLWNDIFIDIFWQAFVNNMEKIRDGEPTDMESSSPTLK